MLLFPVLSHHTLTCLVSTWITTITHVESEQVNDWLASAKHTIAVSCARTHIVVVLQIYVPLHLKIVYSVSDCAVVQYSSIACAVYIIGY